MTCGTCPLVLNNRCIPSMFPSTQPLLVHVLLQGGAEVEEADDEGNSALHYAYGFGQVCSRIGIAPQHNEFTWLCPVIPCCRLPHAAYSLITMSRKTWTCRGGTAMIGSPAKWAGGKPKYFLDGHWKGKWQRGEDDERDALSQYIQVLSLVNGNARRQATYQVFNAKQTR